MQPLAAQSPALHVPSGAHVSPAAQSFGLPQYTGAPPPVPVVPVLVVLVDVVDVDVDVDPPEFEPPVPLPPIPLLVELVVDGTQLTVSSGFFTQLKPELQPHSVQSPGWHWLSLPHVSLSVQSLGPWHDPGVPVVLQFTSQELVLFWLS
jgi:hypothetical protein